MEIFDEDLAVSYIIEKLKTIPEVKTKYHNDDILEVIDIIWDYYEDNGFLDLNIDENRSEPTEDSQEKAKLINHVTKMIIKDKSSRINIDDIPHIVQFELEYEKNCEN